MELQIPGQAEAAFTPAQNQGLSLRGEKSRTMLPRLERKMQRCRRVHPIGSGGEAWDAARGCTERQQASRRLGAETCAP